MKPEALRGWLALTMNLEGYTPFMYIDVKGYVTTGIGNMIESGGRPGGAVSPYEMAWRRHSDGGLATREEITDEWEMVKSHQEMAPLGGFAGNRKLAAIGSPTRLYLDDAAMKDVIAKALPRFEGTMRQRYPAFDTWCADAQVAGMLIAWAYGPAFSNQSKGFRGPIVDYLSSNAWAAAADCFPSSQLTKERNDAIMLCFYNADVVSVNGLEPSLLYYPKDLVRGDDPSGGGGPIPAHGKPPIPTPGAPAPPRAEESPANDNHLLTLAKGAILTAFAALTWHYYQKGR